MTTMTNPIRVGDILQVRQVGDKRYCRINVVTNEEHAIYIKRVINQAIVRGGVSPQYRVMRDGKKVYPM